MSELAIKRILSQWRHVNQARVSWDIADQKVVLHSCTIMSKTQYNYLNATEDTECESWTVHNHETIHICMLLVLEDYNIQPGRVTLHTAINCVVAIDRPFLPTSRYPQIRLRRQRRVLTG